jgi:hypothetical protein
MSKREWWERRVMKTRGRGIIVSMLEIVKRRMLIGRGERMMTLAMRRRGRKIMIICSRRRVVIAWESRGLRVVKRWRWLIVRRGGIRIVK